MAELEEGAVIATIGEAVILWETPFKYQVDLHGFITILVSDFRYNYYCYRYCCLLYTSDAADE